MLDSRVNTGHVSAYAFTNAIYHILKAPNLWTKVEMAADFSGRSTYPTGEDALQFSLWGAMNVIHSRGNALLAEEKDESNDFCGNMWWRGKVQLSETQNVVIAHMLCNMKDLLGYRSIAELNKMGSHDDVLYILEEVMKDIVREEAENAIPSFS